jgi:hypothetical protein
VADERLADHRIRWFISSILTTYDGRMATLYTDGVAVDAAPFAVPVAPTSPRW